ncbi:methyltransferase domain-containing protein [Deferribacter autotrophicus]|uniref:Methyltransferase domain-containing protein n=1 Tax=Deferribacter autotrophicus TaxID=500465 RepID=A0A5A8F2Q6_9BACT|nr:RsmB/NOP family class I SAM-dependent RNA methyltransferase [Deferribacter autotrophicus]KAA0257687.1 methyltransferase domain-containing protein [Deferribacter autotrophicus]
MADNIRRRLYNLLLHFFNGQIKEDFFTDTPYRKFYRKIYFEIFRHFGFIQYVLTKYLKKDTPVESMASLTLGAAQILFLDDIPDYAAVNESVALTPKKQKPLVNAVLRNIVKNKTNLLKEYHIYYDFPHYFFDRWQKEFKDENEFESFLQSFHKVPKYYLVSTNDLSIKEYEEGFNNSIYYPMDINSYTIPLLKKFQNVSNILDCCAAPGGKTILLSKLYPNARIKAVEKNPDRVKVLMQNLKKYKCNNVEAINADFLHFTDNIQYDLILLDAPCTALGTIRKHPEVLWLKNDKDINRMSKYQKKFLEKGLTHLKKGGHLIYSVCSLEPEEGFENIHWLLKKNNNLKLVTPEIDKKFIKDNCFYPLPHKSEGDGFFAAILTY